MRYAARPPHSRGHRCGFLAADFAAVTSPQRRVLGARRGQGRPVAPPQNTDLQWRIEALIAGTRIELHDLGPRVPLAGLPRTTVLLGAAARPLQGRLPPCSGQRPEQSIPWCSCNTFGSPAPEACAQSPVPAAERVDHRARSWRPLAVECLMLEGALPCS